MEVYESRLAGRCGVARGVESATVELACSLCGEPEGWAKITTASASKASNFKSPLRTGGSESLGITGGNLCPGGVGVNGGVEELELLRAW